MITPVYVRANLPAKCRCDIGDRDRAHIMAIDFLSKKKKFQVVPRDFCYLFSWEKVGVSSRKKWFCYGNKIRDNR